MSAISLFAVLSTGIAIGAAGHAAYTSTSEGSHIAASPTPAVHADAEARPVAQPVPAALPLVPEIAAPRECRPEEGIVTECSYN